MSRNRWKRILCFVLAIIAAFSLSLTVYASDGKTAGTSCSLSQIKKQLVCSILSHENLIKLYPAEE